MIKYLDEWQFALRSKHTFYGSFIILAFSTGPFIVLGIISLIFAIVFLSFSLGRAADIERRKFDLLHVFFSALYALSATSFSYSWGMVSKLDFKGGVPVLPNDSIAANLSYGWLIILALVYLIPTFGFLNSPAKCKTEVSRKKADTIGKRLDVWIVLFIVLNVLLLML